MFLSRLPGRGMKVWAPGAEGSVSRRTEKTPLFQRGLQNFTIFYLHVTVILPALSHHLPHYIYIWGSPEGSPLFIGHFGEYPIRHTDLNHIVSSSSSKFQSFLWILKECLEVVAHSPVSHSIKHIFNN